MTRRRRPAARRWAALALTSSALLVGCTGVADPSAAPSAKPSASASASDEAQVQEYVDEESGFAIDFPQEWEVDADAQGVAVRALPPQEETGFADNVTVIVDDTTAGTKEQYLDTALSSAPTLVDDFELVRREVVGDVGLFEFTASAQGSPLHVLVGVVVVDGQAYVASFTATSQTYDERRQTAERVLRSLRPA